MKIINFELYDINGVTLDQLYMDIENNYEINYRSKHECMGYIKAGYKNRSTQAHVYMSASSSDLDIEVLENTLKESPYIGSYKLGKMKKVGEED